MARRRSTKKDRMPQDSYVTPMWCVDGLARAVEEHLPTPDWVVDLGAGDGRIGVAVRERFLHGTVDLDDCHPRLLLVESDASHLKTYRKVLHDKDEFFLQPLEECGGQVDRLLGDSRVLYVSNPPFSLADEWVPKAVTMVKRIHAPGSAAVFLLKRDWRGTWKRADFFDRYPHDREDTLVPRVSFEHGGSDMHEYNWIWWTQGRYMGTDVRTIRNPDSKHAKKVEK